MDSHSVSRGNEEASLGNMNGESEPHLAMDPNLYDAAAKGNVEPFKVMAKDDVERLVTVTNNTILHINIIAQSEDETNTMVSAANFVEDEANSMVSATKFVKEILDLCPSLLLKVNDQGDTPLHTAVKYGRADIVRVLIERAKSQHNDEDDVESGTVGATSCRLMIGMLNKDKNSALHEAVCYDSLDIVKILVKEVPEFPYSANSYGETPLYMAAARASTQMVAEILENCPLPAHQGPNGKTALHAAILGHYYIREYELKSDLIEQIVEKMKSLIRETDQYGWTPLHYSVYFDWTGCTAELLLESDRSAAYIVDTDQKMTPLLLAAAQGYLGLVNLIISFCPECCELVDDRGWNVLHFAMISFHATQLKKLLKNPFVRSLINKKDVNGNTPLHLLALYCRYHTHTICKIGGDYSAVNKRDRSVHQIIRYGCPELKQEIQELCKGSECEKYPKGFIQIRENKWGYRKTNWTEVDENVFETKEAMASQLVVAALIATVTFAAGFTLPGGYKSEEGPNQGTAILSKKSAFQAFVITDTIAMILSLSAVFIYFLMSLKIFKELVIFFIFALLFTLLAMIAMVIAFITGTYAMLSPSLGLAIPTCFIGLSFFLLIFYLLYKALWFKAHEDDEDEDEDED